MSSLQWGAESWATDLAVHIARPSRAPLWSSQTGCEVHGDDDGRRIIGFGDGSRYRVDAADRTIEGHVGPGLSPEDGDVYVRGPVLALGLRLAGLTVLHASTVLLERGAVAVLGPSGAGKSTLTAALLDRGHMLVSDELCAFTATPAAGAPRVARGAARGKLWERSVAALRGDADALPRLVPSSSWWTKRFLDASTRLVSAPDVELQAVAVLVRDAKVDRPALRRLDGPRALAVVGANTLASGSLGAAARESELAALAAVVRNASIWELSFPDDLTQLPAVADALERRFNASAAG